MYDARWGDDPRDADPRDVERRQDRKRSRDDDDTRSLGRGGGSERQTAEDQARDTGDRERSDARKRDGAERERHPGDASLRHVDLPRGPDREHVRDRDRVYTLRGSESRTLATVGAFRVVSSGDLRDHDGGRSDVRSGDLRHLRGQGLIETCGFRRI